MAPENAFTAALPFLDKLLEDIRSGQDRLERKVETLAIDSKAQIEKAVDRIEASAVERMRLVNDKFGQHDAAIEKLDSRMKIIEDDKKKILWSWKFTTVVVGFVITGLTGLWIFLANLPDIIRAYEAFNKPDIIVVPPSPAKKP